MIGKNGILFGGEEPDNFMQGTRSLGELLQKRLAESGDQVSLIDGVSGERVTSRSLRDRSTRVAECLRRIGIRSGDTVGICSENRLEFAYAMFGTFLLGARFTMMNPTYIERELQHTVNLSKPRVMFASSQTVATVQKVAKMSKSVPHTIVFEDDKSIINGGISFSAFLLNTFESRSVFQCEPQNIDKHVSLVMYSSGTTGLPKGVELSQASSARALHRFNNRDRSDEEEVAKEMVILNIIPWYHTYGCHVLLNCALNGHQCVTLPCFEPHSFLSSIKKYNINCTSVAPPLMVFLAKSPLVDNYDVSSLRIIYCGAAPLTKDIEDAVFKRLNSPIIRQGYGMTEGTVSFMGQTKDFHTSGSSGVLLKGIYGRVVDPDTGRVLGPNEEGELQFKGTSMLGYVGDAKATRESFADGGWLRTGDIGYYDDRGEWFVVDRLKELIKYKGFQVAPAELEGLLLKHEKIADVGVIGVADERAGELPMAFVVKQPNVVLSEKEVIDYVADRVSTSKHLRGGVRFVAVIPKNPSGKILRRELRAIAKAPNAKL